MILNINVSKSTYNTKSMTIAKFPQIQPVIT